MYDLHDAPFKIDLFAARHSNTVQQDRFTPSLLFSVETTAQRTSVTFIAIVLEVQSCSQRRFLAKIIRNLIKSSGFITSMHVMRTKKTTTMKTKNIALSNFVQNSWEEFHVLRYFVVCALLFN